MNPLKLQKLYHFIYSKTQVQHSHWALSSIMLAAFTLSPCDLEHLNCTNQSPNASHSLYTFSQMSGSSSGNQFKQENKTFIADADQSTPQTPDAQKSTTQDQSQAQNTQQGTPGPVINFNNVSITEFLRFVSRLTGKNFIFDPQELQFSVTIISETPATLEDVMAALLQNLRIHEYMLIEEGNNFVIHKSKTVMAPAALLKNGQKLQQPDIATQVFQLDNVSSGKVAAIVKTMLSDQAIIEVIEDTSRVIITDFTSNIEKVADLIKKLDTPNSGLEIGQYVALNSSPLALISISEKILGPLAGDKPLVLVPYATSNSIFIISTPFLVEKSLSVLQALDLNQGDSGILYLDQMKFDPEVARQMRQKQLEEERARETPQKLTEDELNSLTEEEIKALLRARGYSEDQINALNRDQKTKTVQEKGLTASERKKLEAQRKKLFESDLPLGQVEATQFLIHKLQYRRSQDVAQALRAIASSLSGGGASGPAGGPSPASQTDLIVTLNSIQTLDENNALVFTGTHASIQKIKELITQIDLPVRQVFIEALILDTSITNSLHYGVEWAGKIERHNFAAQMGLVDVVNNNFSNAFNAVNMPTSPTEVIAPPNLQAGFSAGTIGRKIKYNGKGFRATGALVNALRTDHDTHIIMNPKIVTEHNVPAEIFVGEQIPIKGQSIVNATSSTSSSIVATNYETQETGVLLKVTPLISSSNTVTMIIEQKISSANAVQVAQQGNQNAPPATVNETRTLTRVHLPSDYFLIMSGMIKQEKDVTTNMIPCLGALPIAGFFFQQSENIDTRRNIIIFIKPQIIDSVTDIEEITRREERIFKEKDETTKGIRRNLNDIKTLLNFD